MGRIAARAGIAALALAVLSPGSALAGIFEGYPDAIVCETPRGEIVVFIDRKLKDGTVLYKDMYLNSPIGKVKADGVFRRKGAPGCDGKSLEALRKEGRTFDVYRRN